MDYNHLPVYMETLAGDADRFSFERFLLESDTRDKDWASLYVEVEDEGDSRSDDEPREEAEDGEE